MIRGLREFLRDSADEETLGTSSADISLMEEWWDCSKLLGNQGARAELLDIIGTLPLEAPKISSLRVSGSPKETNPAEKTDQLCSESCSESCYFEEKLQQPAGKRETHRESVNRFKVQYHHLFVMLFNLLGDSSRFANLMFHGLGSKRRIIDAFAEDCLAVKYGLTFIYYSLHAQADFRKFLTGVYLKLKALQPSPAEFDKLEASFPKNPLALARKVNKAIEQVSLRSTSDASAGSSPKICFVIHNLDRGVVSSFQRKALLELASNTKVRFIGSVDEASFFLKWGESQAFLASFLYIHLPTCEDYTEECTSSSDSMASFFGDQSDGSPEKITLDAVRSVMSSLPSRNKELFRLISRMALEQQRSRNTESHAEISKEKIFEQSCQDLIYSDIGKFSLAIGEFLDHGLLIEEPRRNAYVVPLVQEQLLELFPEHAAKWAESPCSSEDQ